MEGVTIMTEFRTVDVFTEHRVRVHITDLGPLKHPYSDRPWSADGMVIHYKFQNGTWMLSYVDLHGAFLKKDDTLGIQRTRATFYDGPKCPEWMREPIDANTPTTTEYLAEQGPVTVDWQWSTRDASGMGWLAADEAEARGRFANQVAIPTTLHRRRRWVAAGDWEEVTP